MSIKTKAYNEWGVPNQLVIVTAEGRFFQSYKSVVAFVPVYSTIPSFDLRIQLDENKWDFSKTTGKYRNLFLNETKEQTQAKIDSGEYLLVDLNC